MNYKQKIKLIQSAKNLDELLDAANQQLDDRDEEQLLATHYCEMPVFGVKEPKKTSGIYSWDENRLMVPGDSLSDKKFKIISRDE